MKRLNKFLSVVVLLGLLITGSSVRSLAVENASASAKIDTFYGDATLADDAFSINENVSLCSADPEIAENSMILNYIDSARFDEAKHVRRLPELEKLNTYVFDNADGTRSVYMMHENVKYVDAQGNIKEKNISLKQKTGGFGIEQSDVELLIPTDIARGVDVEYSEYAVKLIPQGIARASGARRENNSVVYDKAYGEKTKLIYTPILSGIKEDIVLSEYVADAEYSFILKTGGLRLYGDGDGGYYLASDASASPVFYLGDIIVYDAVGRPDKGNMTVDTIKIGQEYLLTISVDDAFLSDPETVYPVTVDPSVTISDSTDNGAVIDAPIFAGYPARNYGAYVYDRVGTPSASYGVGRTVVKLSGLTAANEYLTVSAEQITNVKFYVKDASGGSAQYINIYPLTENTTWTESTVTWNNVGAYSTDVNYGNTMYNSAWTAFDITELVRAWKNGTYSADSGFIMINANEADNKCFFSSEYGTAAYRPYAVMTYTAALSLNYSSRSLAEGDTLQLVAAASPSGSTVTWFTSNERFATVSDTGVVTARKAGAVTVTAMTTDSDGVSQYAYCTVFVHLPNGVYYFNNLSNGDGIELYDDSSYGSNEPLILRENDGSVPSERYRIFKIAYVGNCMYSIRSMLDNTKGWVASDTRVVSSSVGPSDEGLPSGSIWYIKHNGNGYYIVTAGAARTAVTGSGDAAGDGNVTLSSYSSDNPRQTWNINKINSSYRGIDIRAQKTSMSPGETYEFVVTTYSTYAGEYDLSVRWSSGNARIASVGHTSGAVSAVNSGRIAVAVYLTDHPEVRKSVTLTVSAKTTQTAGINSGSVYMIKNASKGTYLKAATSSVLGVTAQDAMDGKQLWYVEWTGNGYRLYSMGIKAELPGSEESMLKPNTASNSPTLAVSTSDTLWNIDCYDGYYYLVNNSSAYNDTSVSADISHDYVRHLSLEAEDPCARWIFEEIPKETFNNYYDGWYVGQGEHIYIKITAVSSLYENNYVDSTNLNAAKLWNGLSSNITIYGIYDIVPENITPLIVEFSGYTPVKDANKYLGETSFYRNNNLVSLHDDVDKICISINTSAESPLANQLNDVLLESVIVHEMGHALKLAHPKENDLIINIANGRGAYSNDNCVCSVMNQGASNIGWDLVCATPKWHDIINLKNKWGG